VDSSFFFPFSDTAFQPRQITLELPMLFLPPLLTSFPHFFLYSAHRAPFFSPGSSSPWHRLNISSVFFQTETSLFSPVDPPFGEPLASPVPTFFSNLEYLRNPRFSTFSIHPLRDSIAGCFFPLFPPREYPSFHHVFIFVAFFPQQKPNVRAFSFPNGVGSPLKVFTPPTSGFPPFANSKKK